VSRWPRAGTARSGQSSHEPSLLAGPFAALSGETLILVEGSAGPIQPWRRRRRRLNFAQPQRTEYEWNIYATSRPYRKAHSCRGRCTVSRSLRSHQLGCERSSFGFRVVTVNFSIGRGDRTFLCFVTVGAQLGVSALRAFGWLGFDCAVGRLGGARPRG
jgi:hypothetical protein